MKLKMAADQVLKRFSRQIRKEDALSLTRLLGGEEKPVPACHSLGMAGPDGAAQEAAESIELGFRCVK
jgi:hypothetical protein